MANSRAITCLTLLLLAGCAVAPRGIEKINHVIVIYQENWSFDGLYGKFPGANGIANAGAAIQTDKDGKPYATLPPVYDTAKKAVDARFPPNLPNAPFDLSAYVKPDENTPDMIHGFYEHQRQINGGKNDRFVAWTDAGALVMSHYDATDLPEGKLAREFTLADNFFQAAFGGSLLNHLWLVCACTPRWKDAPARLVAQVAPDGTLIRDGVVTPDGYAVNGAYSVHGPHPSRPINRERLVPPLDDRTIGDLLEEKGISWKWYAGGWNDAMAGRMDKDFLPHHQPFVYFARYGDGTAAKERHLRDEEEFFADLSAGTLPSVSFLKAIGRYDAHPGFSELLTGQRHVAKLVEAIRASRYWKDAAIIITYDEYGGRWDHVAPPPGDRWGPGSRVPAIIISPYAKRGFVDHTPYDTTSILKFIECRFGLPALGPRDAAANDMTNAFDFGRD